MRLLLEKYRNLRDWIEWRGINLPDVLAAGSAAAVLIGVVALIIGSLF